MKLQTWERRSLAAAVGFLAFLAVSGTVILSAQLINRPFPGFFLYGNLTVVPDFLPDWSGRREGLKFLDRVVAVQGQPIQHPMDLYKIVHRYPVGSQFHYTAERDGRQFQVAVPSMKFTFHDWLLSFGVYILTGIGFLAIGFTPFYLRSASPAATPLFFMVSAIFFWFTTTLDFMTTQALPKEVRIFAFTLTPSLGIHLGLSLTQGIWRRRGDWPYLFLIYSASIGLGLFYSLTFHGPFELWHWALRLAYGYSCLAAIVFMGVLWFALKRPISDLERSRLRVVLVGAGLGFFLPTLGTVLTTSFRWEIPYNLLLILAVFFPLSVAYALLKYSLFDLDVVLKVGLTRGALTGALLLIYVLVVSVLSLSIGVYKQELWAPLFFSILVVLLFNPLLRWIEGVVDRYIYRKEYDPAQLQSEVSALLRSLARPQVTAEKYLRLITGRVGIESARLFFQPAEKDTPVTVPLGEVSPEACKISDDLAALWTEHFGTAKKGISRGEAEADPFLGEARGKLLEIFRALDSDVLIPITFEQAILGFVSLGRKRSWREYSADDIGLLCNLTDQLALSLENGMLFEESEKAKEKYRLLYDQSQVMNRKLIESDQLKKQFVANISHELRTPISTILGYTEVLMDPDYRGDARAILERLASSGRELSQLMDSLLDFSRMETGAMTVSLQEVRLQEILQSLEIMARRLIKDRPIGFRISIESPLDVVETDAKKLHQILMHLLANALKFTEKGEISLEARMVKDGGTLRLAISVADTGIGISKKDQEIIFEDFRQLDGSSTRKYGGTGLGLGLCRKLAQSLGGRIEVESEIGQGSTFTLVMPLQGAPAQRAGSPEL